MKKKKTAGRTRRTLTITAEAKRFREKEWIAALSGTFFADRRFVEWQALYNDDIEGDFGIWHWLMEIAEALNKNTKPWLSVVTSFYEAVDLVIDILYDAGKDPDGYAPGASEVVSKFRKKIRDIAGGEEFDECKT